MEYSFADAARLLSNLGTVKLEYLLHVLFGSQLKICALLPENIDLYLVNVTSSKLSLKFEMHLPIFLMNKEWLVRSEKYEA